MALRADLDVEVVDRRAGDELVAAGAVHLAVLIRGMNVSLHVLSRPRSGGGVPAAKSRSDSSTPRRRRIKPSSNYVPLVGALAISSRNSVLFLVVRILS